MRIILLLLTLICVPCAAESSGQDWLSRLPDKTLLHQIHLPGTHNSAALLEPLPGTAKCQSLTIEEQLNAGIRFLDIRCRHQNSGFSLHHGFVDQKQTFAQLQQTLADFLTQNPSEAIVVSIQETSKPDNNSRSFAETFLSYQAKKPKLWLYKTRLPSLKEVRGKAILLRRFRSEQSLGIDATNWHNKGGHPNNLLVLQDGFKVKKLENKWLLMKQLWLKASDHPNKLALNFASGYQSNKLGIPNITSVSNFINPRLEKHLAANPSLPPSIIILDFITPDLSKAIFSLNFQPQ